MNVWTRIEKTAAFKHAADMHDCFWSNQSFDGTATRPLSAAQFIHAERSCPARMPRCTGRLNLGWTLPYYRAVLNGQIDDIPF